MATITLILPLEATTLNNPSVSRSDSRSGRRGDSGTTSGVTAAAAEQQRRNSRLISERYRSDNGATAEQQQEWQWIDSRINIRSDRVATSGATAAAMEK